MELKSKAYLLFVVSFLGTVAFGLMKLAAIVQAAQGVS